MSPFILMCGQCRRVVSDSNQLLCAVAELDALVFDAVVGVRVSDAVDDNNEGGSLGKLTCSACQAELGRVYYRPPHHFSTSTLFISLCFTLHTVPERIGQLRSGHRQGSARRLAPCFEL